jgi:hypothetical protein
MARALQEQDVHRGSAHFTFGSVTNRNVFEAARPERRARPSSSPVSLLLHQRDQLARHERERDENGRQHNAGQRKDDCDADVFSQGPK